MSQTITISCGSGDCWGAVSGLFETATTDLYVAGSTFSDDDVRTWMPFVVTLPRYLTIVSATLRVVAAQSSTDVVNIKIGCEAADNPSAPSNQTDLFARTLSTATLSTTPGSYTAGTEYSYTITSSVQEILNRSGWVYGNTMAVMIVDNGTTVTRRRQLAAVEHATYAEPKLNIVIPDYFPQGSGLI
jgi:hypothetical protein